jgi:hypothetical protein
MIKVLTPIKAMRAKCLDCTCNQPKEVRLCPVTTCALWPYRMGKRPTEAEREAHECEEAEVCVG